MNRRIIFAFVAVVAALAAACNPAPKKPVATEWAAPEGNAPLESKPPFNVGDVEASLQWEAVVADASKTPAVHVEEMRNAKNGLDLVNVTVGPPRPEQFFVKFSLQFHIAFEQGPVALRATVYRDKQPVDMFGVVLDEHAKAPFDRTMDILAGMPEVPPSMLVYAQADVILLPKGTDVSKVDPLTVTGTPDTTGTVLSNPMRIDFKTAEGAP